MNFHLCVDIRGMLKNTVYPLGYRRLLMNDDMEYLSPKAARDELLDRLSKGEKVIATCDCEGFSPQTGCPGHEDGKTEASND